MKTIEPFDPVVFNVQVKAQVADLAARFVVFKERMIAAGWVFEVDGRDRVFVHSKTGAKYKPFASVKRKKDDVEALLLAFELHDDADLPAPF